MDEPLERAGSACGVGWITLATDAVWFVPLGLLTFCGVGWVDLMEVEASVAAKAVRKSASVPKSSSLSML